MKNEWVKVFTSEDFYRSELVRQALIDNEIDAVIINKQGFPYRIGEVEVHVAQADFERAMALIIANDL